jgi:hypothetical protein
MRHHIFGLMPICSQNTRESLRSLTPTDRAHWATVRGLSRKRWMASPTRSERGLAWRKSWVRSASRILSLSTGVGTSLSRSVRRTLAHTRQNAFAAMKDARGATVPQSPNPRTKEGIWSSFQKDHRFTRDEKGETSLRADATTCIPQIRCWNPLKGRPLAPLS